MLKCINYKCSDYDNTEDRNCKRKKKWTGCKKANLYDSSEEYSPGTRMEGYHCASGSRAWGDEWKRDIH